MALPFKVQKYKKIKRGKLNRLKFKSYLLLFGTIGLKVCQSGVITAKQVEAAKQVIIKKFKRVGKVWARIFPNFPVFKKPLDIRQGKGTGNFSHLSKKVSKGNIIFEVSGVSLNYATIIFKSAACLLYTSPSPRDLSTSRMPSSA